MFFRMIMAICEQFQTENGCVSIPEKLHKYFPIRGDRTSAGLIEPKPRKSRPILKFVRGPKYFEAKFKEDLFERSKNLTDWKLQLRQQNETFFKAKQTKTWINEVECFEKNCAVCLNIKKELQQSWKLTFYIYSSFGS